MRVFGTRLQLARVGERARKVALMADGHVVGVASTRLRRGEAEPPDRLRPLIVVMAGADVFDPYKD